MPHSTLRVQALPPLPGAGGIGDGGGVGGRGEGGGVGATGVGAGGGVGAHGAHLHRVGGQFGGT